MSFRSSMPDVELPEMPLHEFVLAQAERLADKPAIICGATGRGMTYGDLALAVRRVASSLTARGFGKGDVLAIHSANVPEYVVGMLAAVSVGGVVTTSNPLSTSDELAFQLRDAGASIMMTMPQLMGAAAPAAHAAHVKKIYVFGEAEGARPFAELLDGEDRAPEVEIDPLEDLAALPYSSGTTGLPKGVMLTHHNITSNISQFSAFGLTREDDRLICVLPLFHIYGMVAVMFANLHIGSTVVTMPRFDLEQFLHTLQQHRITFAHVVPPIVLALAKHPIVDRYDLSALEVVFSGAAPLGAELSRECRDRLGCLVLQGYGMTEASPATHLTPRDPERVKLGSVGYCVPNMECRVVDVETEQECGPNEKGEIRVRGPQVMKGYLNNPKATKLTIGEDGFLRTGDVGYADEDGCFFIVDRVKELIKYKGFQIAPAELEAVLLSHPAIADAAVIPMEDVEAGEVPKALVVLHSELAEDEIKAFVAGRVAPYKKLRAVEVVKEIPKSASGKILRRVLVERERGRE